MVLFSLTVCAWIVAEDEKGKESKPDGKAIPLKLPMPAFLGTPGEVPPGVRLEKPRKGPRPEFLAPEGSRNLALEKPVTSSDSSPTIGSLELITDGDKEATDRGLVELAIGPQYVQIDLGELCELHAVVFWHYHHAARIYHDVVVQVAEDKDFILGVKTLYNNDHDNSAGLGIGEAREYWETYEGRLVAAKKVKARFVRLTANGNTSDDRSHYVEVEVYGTPVAAKD